MEGHNLRFFQKIKKRFWRKSSADDPEKSISERKLPKRVVNGSLFFFFTAEQIYKTVEMYVVLMNQKRFLKIAI